jgi:Lipoprotein LpqB beta-propeller domain/Sporulation and spore germination
VSRRSGSAALLVSLLLGAALLAGCASVPDSSPVEPLRKITEGYGPLSPPGPGENVSPLDLVAGFVNASASPANQHAAARRFLTPDSRNWDDTGSLTVLDEPLSLTFIGSGDDARSTVRLHGTELGRLDPDGSFQQDQTTVDLTYQVGKVHGQWRVDAPPSGVIVGRVQLLTDFKAVKLYFVDPTRHHLVADRRYLAANPAQSMPSRVMDGLLGGPSGALAGAAVSALPRTARLRSNVAPGPNGSVTVDLTELGDLDDSQRSQIAEQVVFSMAQVGVGQVTLLDDGAPLILGHQNLMPDYFTGVDDDDAPDADVPGLVVVDGRVHTMTTSDVGAPMAGPAGSGDYALSSATMSQDGHRLAVVSRQAGRQLLVGVPGGPLIPSGVRAAALTAPTWTPDASEVWTVRDNNSVSRVVFDQMGHTTVAGVDAAALSAIGPISDLRLSRNGAQVAAVVGGQLVVGAVIRSPNDVVRIGNVRILRPVELTELISVAWAGDDKLAVAGRKSGFTVGEVSVDGLDLRPLPSNNLTPPLTSIAAAPGRPLLVTDQSGLWSFGMDEVGSWRQVAGGAASVVGYPD